MRAAVVIAAALLCVWAHMTPAQAQNAPMSRSPVLTIDQDRLFQATRPGQRAAQEIEAEARALAEENRQLEEELLAEERRLTEQRDGLTPEEFTALADAFDARVRGVRSSQDAKARALAARQEQLRQDFFVEISDILTAIVNERGAAVVLDRREVFVSADRVDITDDVIARVNARAAAGAEDDAQ